jgi:DNA modification methylase
MPNKPNNFTIHNTELTAWAKEELARIAGSSTKYHAVLSDPPYGIAFMGKQWDDVGGPAAFQSQVKLWGDALMPLLYPGAVVMMFGGTRMWHRLAAGMEDAGFELWDTMMWLYGSGFPKLRTFPS